VSAEDAITTSQEVDPSLLAGSTSANLEGSTLTPALTDAGEGLQAEGTLTSSMVSKETAGAFSINTPEGQIAFTPVDTAPAATTLPTVVNGSAAFFANTWTATDTIVRPEPLGADTLLQLRSLQAPNSFSWELHLGAGQELRQLSGGAVALVDTTSTPEEPDSASEVESEPQTKEEAKGVEAPEEEPGEAEEEESGEEEPQEEVPLEGLPAAPVLTVSPTEPIGSEPHPDQTGAVYETDAAALATAEAQEPPEDTLAVIERPTATDASGGVVASSLSASGETVTLHLEPGEAAAYPIIVDPRVVAPKNAASSARHEKYAYGLSDEDPNSLEQSGADPEEFDSLDPHLRNGPLHVGTTRLIVPYNVLSPEYDAKNRAEENEEAKDKERVTQRHRLIRWLVASSSQHLIPFLTLRGTHCRIGTNGKFKGPCPPPPHIAQYEQAITPLVAALATGHGGSGLPAVKVPYWGAWNEPDLGPLGKRRLGHEAEVDQLRQHPGIAAKLWMAARSSILPVCGTCKVVAGEFQEDDGGTNAHFHEHYVRNYEAEILRLASKCHPARKCKPHVWGLHDYHDVVHKTQSAAARFRDTVETPRLESPYIWITEAGVELHSGESPTVLVKGTAKQVREHQRSAAIGFLHLHDVSPHIDQIYYYSYRQPREYLQKENSQEFDSGLVEAQNNNEHVRAGANDEGHARPAYCVLAFGNSFKHRCPPTVEAGIDLEEVGGVSSGGAVCSGGNVKVTWSGTINPNDSSAKYRFEYGTTTSYGHVTPWHSVAAGTSDIAVSEPLEVPKEAGGPGGNCATVFYRLVGENEAGESESRPSKLTFETVVAS
jgi:hypothetical protein